MAEFFGGLSLSVANGLYLKKANNLSDLTNASTARTNLGVAIGSDVQAWDANLDQIAALSSTDNNFIVGNGSAWALETPSDARTSLGLVAGGAGDIWVEKAGDAMTGALSITVSSAVLSLVVTNSTGTGSLSLTQLTRIEAGHTVNYYTSINANSSVHQVIFESSATTASADFVFQPATGTTMMFMDSSTQRVAIGTETSPTALLHLGDAGSQLGDLAMAGNTSGVVTVTPAAAAGTWTLTLPTSGGTDNYALVTNGSGITAWEAVVNTITGTANQVVASAATGAVTLSLPQSIATSSRPEFAGLDLTAYQKITTADNGTAIYLKVTGATDFAADSGWLIYHDNNGGAADTLVFYTYSGSAGAVWHMNKTVIYPQNNKTQDLGTTAKRLNVVYNATNTTGTSRLTTAKSLCKYCDEPMIRGTGTNYIAGEKGDYIQVWCVECQHMAMEEITHLPVQKLSQRQNAPKIIFKGLRHQPLSGNVIQTMADFQYDDEQFNSTVLGDVELEELSKMTPKQSEVYLYELGLREWYSLEEIRLIKDEVQKRRAKFDILLSSFEGKDLKR